MILFKEFKEKKKYKSSQEYLKFIYIKIQYRGVEENIIIKNYYMLMILKFLRYFISNIYGCGDNTKFVFLC